MKRLFTLPFLATSLFAQEPNKDIKEGHSHNGHAFNEGAAARRAIDELDR